jgi:hypothetical protein
VYLVQLGFQSQDCTVFDCIPLGVSLRRLVIWCDPFLLFEERFSPFCLKRHHLAACEWPAADASATNHNDLVGEEQSCG